MTSGTVHGRAEVSRYLAELPAKMKKVLAGAGLAGGRVIAEDAKQRCRSDYVAERITVKAAADADQVRTVVTVKPGYGRSVAIWLEYGTSGHFITVDDSVREGMTAGRINRNADAARRATLIINGKPVGATIYHPGAQPYPFLRPALDASRSAAVAAAGGYIASRINRGNVMPETDSREDQP